MRCPHDNAALTTHTHKSVTLDVCELCHGVWVDGGEFEKLTLHFSAPALHGGTDIRDSLPIGDGKTTPKDFWQEDIVACPRDGVMMQKHYFAGTTIGLDHCETCDGYWLGGAELSAAAREVEPHPVQDAMGRFVLKELSLPPSVVRDEARSDPRVPEEFAATFHDPAQLLWVAGNFLFSTLLR